MDWLTLTCHLIAFAVGCALGLGIGRKGKPALTVALAEAQKQASQIEILRAFDRARAEAAVAEVRLVREKVVQLQSHHDMPDNLRAGFEKLREELHHLRDRVSGSVEIAVTPRPSPSPLNQRGQP